jgi:hypothetical protein
MLLRIAFHFPNHRIAFRQQVIDVILDVVLNVPAA